MSAPSMSTSPTPGPSTHQTSDKPRPFAGHDGAIRAIRYSPDGKQIATGGSDPPIRIWHSDTGEVLFGPQGHASYVDSVCYSPNGRRLASGDGLGTVCIWDTSVGDLVLQRVEAHPGVVSTIAYSPDNQHLASGGFKSVRIWRAEDLTETIEISHPHGVISVNFSPDGTCLATACADFKIRIFDVEMGTIAIGPLEGHTSAITAVTYSPNGEELASCSNDKTIRTWDASTGSALLGPLEGHVDTVACVVYSPDGRHLVSGSSDCIRLWDSQLGELIGGPVRGHDGMIAEVCFAPDGTRFVTGAIDRQMRVWDASTREILSPELTEDEKDRYRLTGPFRGHLGRIHDVAYFPDGERIASRSDDCTIRIWDALTGKLVLGPLGSHGERVSSIAISSDGSRLVGGGSSKIRVWDTATGDVVLGPLEGHRLTRVKFSPDDRLIASLGPKKLILWDAETGEQLRSTDEGAAMHTYCFSADGSRLVSGSKDGFISFWDVSTLERVAGPFPGHGGFINSIVLSPDGHSIASGSHDRTVRVWDAKTGVTTLGPLKAHSGFVMSVSYSSDGTQICSGSSNGAVCLWHAQTGDLLLGHLKVHHGPVTSAEFSPNGSQIVTGSLDGTIKFWDTTTGERIHFPHTDDDQSDLSFLDMPVTHMLGQASETQPIQQIALGSVLDPLATARLQDFSDAAAPPVHDDSIVRSAFFPFTRLRRAITRVFRNSRSVSDAVELGERHHRWAPKPVRTAYARIKHFVVVASRTPPRKQAILDLSDEPGTWDSGGSARQTRDGENASSPKPIGVTNTLGSQPADPATQRGRLSMQPSTPYVASGPAEAPYITFVPGSIESDDSFEVDCCACCPRWCVCLHW